MDKLSKHDKILEDYPKSKREHLKYIKKKVLEMDKNFNILRSKQFNINIKKLFK